VGAERGTVDITLRIGERIEKHSMGRVRNLVVQIPPGTPSYTVGSA
jgi:hypothetical protein